MAQVEEKIWDQVEGILRSGIQLALATTGGGSQLAFWLLNHPGASQAVMEVQVPYHPAALGDYLGAPGPHRVEARTALELAGRAYRRVQLLTGGDGLSVGMGCTAALATDRARRGEDRAYLALRWGGAYRIYTLGFVKGVAGRLEQEEVLSRLGLQALSEVCGGASGRESWPDYVRIEARTVALDDPLALVLGGEVAVVEVDGEGQATAEVERRGRLLFPGSFNPLHQGHVELAAAAWRQCGRPVCLEISVENVDKPPLSREELEKRIAPLRGQFPVVVTRAPTFVEKARLFGACCFVIGLDTAMRLFAARYYDGGEAGMRKALEEMAGTRCRFLVAGRLIEGVYRTLDDIEIPGVFRTMFASLPEEAFRLDISSTEIRARKMDL